MKLNHSQIVKDYNKLKQMYGIPEDLTGGMVIEEVLMKAVEIGTKNSCAKAVLEIIEYGFQATNNEVYRYEFGSSYKEVSIYECDFIKYISETYLQ